MPATTSDLLLLADGRLPAGGHAHSGGLEQAVELGDVRDIATLEGFLDGLLRSNAGTAIAVAAAACAARIAGSDARLIELDVEESARTPSAALRVASRAQGRQLLRAAEAIWPEPGRVALPPLPHGPHLALAQGLAAARLDLSPLDAARLAAYAAISGPATAAVRLLGLDPFSVHGTVARVVRGAEPLLVAAADAAGDGAAALPCGAAPLIEIGAELHRVREIRMFAS
ncbi:MAG: urease accessory UreF family protein [Solirubrobacteraceae bacterium]|nr:urease accessory UreF family protein [Patulibacter sp.]